MHRANQTLKLRLYGWIIISITLNNEAYGVTFMNTVLSRIVVVVVIVSLLLSSCNPSTQTPTITPTERPDLLATSTAYAQETSEAFADKYDIGVTTTGDERFGIVAAHTNGEKLAAMTQLDQDGSISSVNGAVWLSPEEKAFVVFNGPDGLPERVVAQDFVFIFSNYTDSIVDVTVVSPEKKVEVVYGVEVNRNELLELQSLLRHSSDNSLFVLASYHSIDKSDENFLRFLKLTLLSVSVAACVVLAITTAAPTLGAALAVLALPCGAAIISAISLAIEDNPSLEGLAAAFNAISCITDPAQAALCLLALLDIIISVVDASVKESTEATALLESPPEIEPSKLVLDKNYYCRTGPDSSYPDVTGFFPGTELEIIGQNNGWYLVDIEKAGVQSKFNSCWIGGGELVGGDLSAIPVVQPSNPAPGAGPSKNKPDKPNQPSGSSYP